MVSRYIYIYISGEAPDTFRRAVLHNKIIIINKKNHHSIFVVIKTTSKEKCNF